MNLSVSHYICGEDIPFLDFIRNVSDAGITSVGITCPAIEEMGLHDLRSCLNDYGLSVSSLNSAGYFTHSADRPNKYSDEELVEYSAYLNSDILCVITGGLGSPATPLLKAHDYVENQIEKLAEIAAMSEVTIGLEPINPVDIFSKGCVNSISHAINIIRPHNNAKLILDFYHSWWDQNFVKVINEDVDQIGLVQICNVGLDADLNLQRRPLTAGVIDLENYLQKILTGDYSGKLELELFNENLNNSPIKDVIKHFSCNTKKWLKSIH